MNTQLLLALGLAVVIGLVVVALLLRGRRQAPPARPAMPPAAAPAPPRRPAGAVHRPTPRRVHPQPALWSQDLSLKRGAG